MGAAKFTPGPWFASKHLEPLGGCLSRLVMAIDTAVAEVLFDDEDDPTAEANTHLIAAAPDLHEAVERALRHAENIGIDSEGSSYVNQLRAALAKARGEA